MVKRVSIYMGGTGGQSPAEAQVNLGVGNAHIDGSISNPSIGFLSDPNSGLYSYDADTIGIAAGGALVAHANTDGLYANSNTSWGVPIGTTAQRANRLGAFRYNSDLDNLEAYRANGWVEWGSGGGGISSIPDGTAAEPGLYYTTEFDLGLYKPLVNTIGFATAGHNRLSINSTYVTISNTTLNVAAVSSEALNVEYTADSADAGPFVNLIRRSASPAAFDLLGGVRFLGANSGGDITSYGDFTAAIIDPTGGSENGGYFLTTRYAGSEAIRAVISGGLRLGVTSTFYVVTVPDPGPGSIAIEGKITTGSGNTSYVAYGFNNDLHTGMYKDVPANTVAFATAGTSRLTINSSHIETSVSLRPIDNNSTGIGTVSNRFRAIHTSNIGLNYGSAAAPGLFFNDDFNTGIYHDTPNDTIAVTTNGTSRLTINATSATISVPHRTANGTASAPSYAFSGASNMGMFRDVPAHTLGFATQGSSRLTMNSAGINASVSIRGPAGTVGGPSFGFATDSTTGMYLDTPTNTIAWTAGSVKRLTLNATSVTSGVAIRGADGTAASPTFSFSDDTNTGIYHDAPADTIAVTTDGTKRVTVNATSIASTVPVQVNGIDLTTRAVAMGMTLAFG